LQDTCVAVIAYIVCILGETDFSVSRMSASVAMKLVPAGTEFREIHFDDESLL
jgi:hypothetical protein